MTSGPVNWDEVPWTPFKPATMPGRSGLQEPDAVFLNSRYQVSMFLGTAPEPFGSYAHLSIKVRDKSARHDWRDMQRIKNEICGEDFDAVEIYPAERKLVDTANQYHLWVFRNLQLPFGFQTRLVAEGVALMGGSGSVQRPFDVKPPDMLSGEELDKMFDGITRR